jgi:hypothetical protein
MTTDPLPGLHDDLGVLAVALVPFRFNGTVVAGSLLMLRAVRPGLGKPAWRGRHVILRPGGRVTFSGEGIRHETNRSRLRGPGRACPGRVQQSPVIPGFAA